MDYSAPARSLWKLAPGSLTSGGNHHYSERLASRGGHLYTDGLPATAATPARAKRSSPPSSYGGEDKTIQERGRHLHGVRRLVQPPRAASNSTTDDAGDATDVADLRTVRPSPVWRTNSHAPLGGGRQRRRRHQSHQSQRDGAAARLASHPKELGREGWSRGSARRPPSRGWWSSFPPNAGGRSRKERRLHGHPAEVGDDGRLKDEAKCHG
jgi:hypothetical protein